MLFVCTGNICRSPLAERVARSYVDAVLGADAASVRLESAGTRAVVNSGIHPRTAAVLTSLGGNGDGFLSRQLTDDMAVDADLTLALTRAHRHEVLKRSPRGLSRTFTLLEAADLVSLAPPTAARSEATFPDRCRALVRLMAAARGYRASDVRDDILDPVREPEAFHLEVGDVIADGVARLFSRFADLSATAGVRDGRHDETSAYSISRR